MVNERSLRRNNAIFLSLSLSLSLFLFVVVLPVSTGTKARVRFFDATEPMYHSALCFLVAYFPLTGVPSFVTENITAKWITNFDHEVFNLVAVSFNLSSRCPPLFCPEFPLRTVFVDHFVVVSSLSIYRRKLSKF